MNAHLYEFPRYCWGFVGNYYYIMRLQRPHIIFKTDIYLNIHSLNGSPPVRNGHTVGKSFKIGRTGGDPFKEWIYSQISVLNIMRGIVVS